MPDVASQVESDKAERDVLAACAVPTRRFLLASVLVAGAGLAAGRSARAQDDPGGDERPQKDDLLVVSEGPNAGQIVKPSDLTLGGPPVHAWPKDPKTAVVRDGSRLNEIIVMRFDPAELDDDTRARSADGIVAYSAICTHAGCPITAWVKGETSDNNVLKCMCHNSEFDARASAQVVFGPAPRRLAALPLAISGDSLAVAAPFAGKVGAQQTG
jgi:rieske iron-sulfur protein